MQSTRRRVPLHNGPKALRKLAVLNVHTLLDAPDAVGDRRGCPHRTAGDGALNRPGATPTRLCARPIEPVLKETIARIMGVPASKVLKHA
jgi:hypothetical protein